MPTVQEINTSIKKFAADCPNLASELPKLSKDFKEAQGVFATESQKLMQKAGAVDALANKAKADIKVKYDAEIKVIDDKLKAEKEAARKTFTNISKTILTKFDIPNSIAKIENLTRGCKMMGDSCEKSIKELPKAAGDAKLKKETEVLAAKTLKEYRTLQAQYAAAAVSGKKTMESFPDVMPTN